MKRYSSYLQLFHYGQPAKTVSTDPPKHGVSAAGKANFDRENEQHPRFKVGNARKGREQIYENMTNYNEKMVGGWKDDFNFVLVFVRPDLSLRMRREELTSARAGRSFLGGGDRLHYRGLQLLAGEFDRSLSGCAREDFVTTFVLCRRRTVRQLHRARSSSCADIRTHHSCHRHQYPLVSEPDSCADGGAIRLFCSAMEPKLQLHP